MDHECQKVHKNLSVKISEKDGDRYDDDKDDDDDDDYADAIQLVYLLETCKPRIAIRTI